MGESEESESRNGRRGNQGNRRPGSQQPDEESSREDYEKIVYDKAAIAGVEPHKFNLRELCYMAEVKSSQISGIKSHLMWASMIASCPKAKITPGSFDPYDEENREVSEDEIIAAIEEANAENQRLADERKRNKSG